MMRVVRFEKALERAPFDGTERRAAGWL